MTPQQRKAARERCEKATAGTGPWQAIEMWGGSWCVMAPGWPGQKNPACAGGIDIVCTLDSYATTPGDRRANVDFIAHARTDLPAALAEIDRLEAEIARMKGPERTAEDEARTRAAMDAFDIHAIQPTKPWPRKEGP